MMSRSKGRWFYAEFYFYFIKKRFNCVIYFYLQILTMAESVQSKYQ